MRLRESFAVMAASDPARLPFAGRDTKRHCGDFTLGTGVFPET